MKINMKQQILHPEQVTTHLWRLLDT